MKSSRQIILLLLLLLAQTLLAEAHVPIISGDNEDNEDITRALHISDPVKSWAVYGTMLYGSNAQADARYFSLDLEKGQTIALSLFKSADEKEGNFHPSLILLGPGLLRDDGAIEPSALLLSLPTDISKNLSSALSDDGWSLSAIRATVEEPAVAVYEPFGPGSFIELARINVTAPESARYYAMVYHNSSNSDDRSERGDNSDGGDSVDGGDGGNSSDRGNGEDPDDRDSESSGHFGLSIGYSEEASFSDRIVTPIRLIQVYMWEGQSPGTIMLPFLAAEAAALLFFWRSKRRTSFSLAGHLAGFLFLATASLVFSQMVFSLTRAPFGSEVYITLLIGAFHALLGVAAIRLARGEAGILQRALLAVIGTLALLAGSGLLMGPVLAMASSFLPSISGSIFRRSGTEVQASDSPHSNE